MEKILFVIDMQNDFIDGALGTKEAEGIVPFVIEKIKAFPGKVFYTMDTHTPKYLTTQEGRFLPVVHCVKGTEGWEIQNDVKKAGEGKTIQICEKETFGSSALIYELEKLQKEGQIDTKTEFYFIGLCTDICVISNAMTVKAFFPENPIIVDSSCCAGVTPKSHYTALEAMKMCQIKID